MASGFQLREQSASAQGTAFAGVTAGGSDISTMFFNPATMAAFDGFQLVLGATSVAPKAELGGATATRAALGAPFTALGHSTIAGPGATGDAANNAVLPELYAMWSVTKDFKLGLSVNAPFGLVTEYDSNFVGRYHGLKSDLKTVDISLSASYRVTPMVSVGASVISRKVDATLSNAVDFGQITFLGLAQLANPAYTNFIPSSTTSVYDGKATVTGSKNVVGYKLGLVFDPSSTFHAGLAYQSATVVKIAGNVHYDYPTIASPALAGAMAAVTAGGHLVDGTANAEVNLPDTTSLGLSWNVTPTVTLAFEADRTGWAKFEELRFKFGSGQADSVTDEKWRNTMFYSVGATWKATQALTLRAGVATDQGAVDPAYRTPRIPDADRTWMSVGAGYAFTKNFSVDAAYTHIAVKDGDVNLTSGAASTAPNFFRGNLSGTFKNSIEIMALHAKITF
jgi:long-chain fatty acid transport protein